MNAIKHFMKKHPAWFSAIVFAIGAVVINVIWVACFGMAHIYDIIHVIPTVLIYEPIIDMMGGLVSTELIFIPLAMIMDAIIGLGIGALLGKYTKHDKAYSLGLIIAWLVYTIVITYQWLPII